MQECLPGIPKWDGEGLPNSLHTRWASQLPHGPHHRPKGKLSVKNQWAWLKYGIKEQQKTWKGPDTVGLF